MSEKIVPVARHALFADDRKKDRIFGFETVLRKPKGTIKVGFRIDERRPGNVIFHVSLGPVDKVPGAMLFGIPEKVDFFIDLRGGNRFLEKDRHGRLRREARFSWSYGSDGEGTLMNPVQEREAQSLIKEVFSNIGMMRIDPELEALWGKRKTKREMQKAQAQFRNVVYLVGQKYGTPTDLAFERAVPKTRKKGVARRLLEMTKKRLGKHRAP